jgi:hypothetical protein
MPVRRIGCSRSTAVIARAVSIGPRAGSTAIANARFGWTDFCPVWKYANRSRCKTGKEPRNSFATRKSLTVVPHRMQGSQSQKAGRNFSRIYKLAVCTNQRSENTKYLTAKHKAMRRREGLSFWMNLLCQASPIFVRLGRTLLEQARRSWRD